MLRGQVLAEKKPGTPQAMVVLGREDPGGPAKLFGPASNSGL